MPMAVSAHLQPAKTRRTSSRRALSLGASGRLKGSAEANVMVRNISEIGLLLETALDMSIGEGLTIDLPEAGAVDAIIMWRSGQLYGCAFEQALSSAALAAAHLKSDLIDRGPDSAAGDFGETIAPAFGKHLSRVRRERGLTLSDVAEALGVSRPTVWAWEKGRARPLPDRLEALAATLGVGLEELAELIGSSSEVSAMVEEFRNRVAAALNVSPGSVRIMIDL